MSVTLTVMHADTSAEGGTAAVCSSATSQPVTGLELVQHVLSTVGGESDLRTVSPSVCLSQCLSVSVLVCLSVCLSVSLSVCLSLRCAWHYYATGGFAAPSCVVKSMLTQSLIEELIQWCFR